MNQPTLDPHLRSALHVELRRPGQLAEKGACVIDELKFYAGREEARADVVVIPERNQLHCYEIKSCSDTLDQLKRQVRVYSKVMDFLTLVTTTVHFKHAKKMVPKFWGITLYNASADRFTIDRPAEYNPDVDPKSLVTMLWKPQALALLTKYDAERGVLSKPKWVIHKRVLETFEGVELIHDAVCEQYRTHRRGR